MHNFYYYLLLLINLLLSKLSVLLKSANDWSSRRNQRLDHEMLHIPLCHAWIDVWRHVVALFDVMHDALFDVTHMRCSVLLVSCRAVFHFRFRFFCWRPLVTVSVFDIFFVSLDVSVFVSSFCSYRRVTNVTIAAWRTGKYCVNFVTITAWSMGKYCVSTVTTTACSTGKYLNNVTITAWSVDKYSVNNVTITAWNMGKCCV